MGEKVSKTNAARLLDRAKIHYELIPYRVDEDDLAAVHVAEQLGEPIERVFKTLVLRGDWTGVLICVVPGDAEVDLKAAARASGNKSVEMLHMKDLLPTTGYIRGGCSPVGMKKQFVTVYDESCLAQPTIMVSGGRIGTQVECAPADLIKVTRGKTAAITQEHQA